MPPVTRQNANGPAARKPAKGGAAGRIRPIGFGGESGIKILLYGQSGTGKTRTWATFPKPILCLLCSGGDEPGETRSIDTPENRRSISQVVIEASDEIDELVDYAAGRYKTIVIDHCTGLQDKVLAEILGLDQLPAQKSWGMARQQDYGQCALLCKERLKRMLTFKGNVVFVAQERLSRGGEEAPDTSSDLIQPSIGAGLMPSLAGWLNTAADYICQTFKRQQVRKVVTVIGKGDQAKKVESLVPTKKVEFCLRTGPHVVVTTKFRSTGDELPDDIVNPSYDKIMAVISGAEAR